MAEFVTCPACGCSVQVADTLLGRRVRCFGCKQPFVVAADRSSPPLWRGETPASPGIDAPRSETPDAGEDEAANGERRPLCPGCGRRITWGDLRCPFCDEELDPEDNVPRRRRDAVLVRRDAAPHRGPLIVSLGNLSAIVGGLTLCTFGFGACFSIPVGILTWMMANHDLEHMRDGRMDPRGKTQTEVGRTSAIVGILLGLIFAAFFALVYLAK
jgi:hypothetical protein